MSPRLYATIDGWSHLIRSDIGPPYLSWCGRDLYIVKGTLQPDPAPEAKPCGVCSWNFNTWTPRRAGG